jgi:hypothetical protein
MVSNYVLVFGQLDGETKENNGNAQLLQPTFQLNLETVGPKMNVGRDDK